MKQLSRRILLLLALLAMLAVGAQDALAQQEGVSYYYHEWDYDALQGKNRVFNYGAICKNYKVLDPSTSLSASKDFGVGNNPEWDDGGYKWVVVKGEVTINTLSVIGEGHLILTDGCKLTCTGGVWLSGSSSLTIYSQSSGENEGQLIVTQSNKGCAGIGSWKQEEANGSPVSMGSLTIHGGKIEATGAQYGAGIGGGEDRGIQSGCTYTQYGGDVRAIGGENAAGIGGGDDGSQGGKIVIYGGIVKAQGGDNGAGIGGGDGECGGHVVVEGSTADVTATGGKNAAGIGGGNSGDASDWPNYELLTVNDGKVTAIGGVDGAGIGAGWRTLNEWKGTHHCNGGVVTVNGGEVTAQGGYHAAGIGLGGNYTIAPNDDADYGTLTVTGGTVKATGGESGAGIGGGNRSRFYRKEKSKCTISGGTVIAQGGKFAAGIGGGNNSPVQSVIISGGTVTATGGRLAPGIGAGKPQDNSLSSISYVTISGGKVTATGGSGGGAGIGGAEYYGQSSIFPIKISGGEVKAEGSTDGGAGIGAGCETGNCDELSFTGGTIISIAHGDWVGGAIGWGKKGDPCSILIGADLLVSNGTTVESLTPVQAGQRSAACHDPQNLCVKIEPCDHAAFSNYTFDDDNHHTAHCKYCSDYSEQQEHQYTDGKCACGKEKEVKPETVSITLYRAKDATSGEYDNGLLLHVVKGEKYTITTCNAPEGLTFMGWMQDPATAPADYEMRDGDFMNLVDAGMELTPTTDINLYARYRYRYTDEWTWSDDWSSATVTIKLGDQTIVENKVAEISDNSLAPTAENPDGTFGKTATYAWTKGDDIVYNFSDIVSRPVSLALTLSDDSDNSALLEQAVGTTYQTVTLAGRTLYKDGSWNTLCLPFAVTTASGPLSGDGVVAQVLDAEKSSLSDDGKLSLTFKDAPATIPAGLPFIIKWNAEGSDIVSPTFGNVTITTPQPASANFRGGSFVGQFSPFQITDDNINAIILLTDNNTLGYSKSSRTLRSCRAHFEVLREMTSSARLMTGYSITFGPGAEAESTAISAPATEEADGKEGWYTLGGQRLSSRPVRKGIYVRQGRKVVIR